jgi:gamma-glutamylcyclotransferase (GGCT)/AIG2-like uncharacterized protein YtfP
MSGAVLYFAYGSNLDAAQMRARCPRSRALQPAVLAGYRLAFRGYAPHWGGGVATLLPARNGRVPGRLYRLGAGDLDKLDAYEGYPDIYARAAVRPTARDGTRPEALTYLGRIGEPHPPSLRYLLQMWRVYLRLGLDAAALLAAVQEAMEAAKAAETAGPDRRRR